MPLFLPRKNSRRMVMDLNVRFLLDAGSLICNFPWSWSVHQNNGWALFPVIFIGSSSALLCSGRLLHSGVSPLHRQSCSLFMLCSFIRSVAWEPRATLQVQGKEWCGLTFTHLITTILGTEILLPISCVNMSWKNCVLQPAAGKTTQFVSPQIHRTWESYFCPSL